MSEENKTLARRFLVAQASGDMETLDELMAPDFVDRSLLPARSLAARTTSSRSPTCSLCIPIPASRSRIRSLRATWWRAGSREPASIAASTWAPIPTGQETRYSGIHIHRIADGKIVEEWSEADNLEVVQPALEQEMRRRKRIEQEKMAALGKLSAGLAHELNNPAAAALRAAGRLREVLLEAQLLALEHSGRLSGAEREALVRMLSAVSMHGAVLLDPLLQSDREEEIAGWLEQKGKLRTLGLAPSLGAAGLDTGRLEELAAQLGNGEPLGVPSHGSRRHWSRRSQR